MLFLKTLPTKQKAGLGKLEHYVKLQIFNYFDTNQDGIIDQYEAEAAIGMLKNIYYQVPFSNNYNGYY